MTVSRPSGCLVAGSIGVLIAVLFLMRALATPIPQGCLEYCGLDRTLWTWVVRLALIGWLAAVIVTARSARQPRAAARAVIAGGGVLLAISLGIFGIIRVSLQDIAMLNSGWTVGMGLLLPGIWQLARTVPPSGASRTLAAVAGVATVIAAIWSLIVPAGVRALSAPPIDLLAWLTFELCVVGLATVGRRTHALPGWAKAGLFIGGLPVVFMPAALMAPGPLGFVVLSSVPLSALAWLAIGAWWRRGTTAETNDVPGSDRVEDEEPS